MTMRKRNGAKRAKVFKKPSLTEQHHKEACDVSRIIKRYDQTGMWNHVNNRTPNYTDLPDPVSFHEAMNKVTAVTQAFEGLPAAIRQDMGNSPKRLLEFLQDPDNRSQMEEYGFDVSHIPVPVAPDTPEAPPLDSPAPKDE